MKSFSHIVAREFDYLVPSRKGREDCHFVGKAGFDSLREFALSNREGDSPLELMRLCSPKGIGEALKLQNYVGVVETCDGLQVEILPKIDVSSGGEKEERAIFARMLAELGSDVSFKVFDQTGLATGKTPLFEVFVAMFLEEVAALVRHGIRSDYVRVESAERYVKGKIDFPKEAKKGPARADVINIIHDELLPDRPENRLIKSTLMFLRGVSRSGANIRKAMQLALAFDGVSESRNVDADLAKCFIDRSTKVYGTLIAWCRVFLKGESFTMFRGESIAMALLFPMERIFEDYVGKTLRRKAAQDSLLRRVRLQAMEQWLFDGNRVSLRPDILCECSNGRQIVLDTKWKRVNGPKDISVADMHQMYAYGQRYRAEGDEMQNVVLLYPWHEGVEPGWMERGRHVSSDGVRVDMFFVDLENMNASMSDLLTLVGELAG